MILTLAALAAEPKDVEAEACSATVVDTLPRPYQVDVPVDAALVVFLESECSPLDPVSLRLLLHGEEVATRQLSPSDVYGEDGATAMFTWRLPTELAPQSNHVLEITPLETGVSTELQFTTGDARAVALDGAPGVDFLPIWSSRGEVFLFAEVTVADDPDGSSWIELEPPHGETAVAIAGGAGQIHDLGTLSGWQQDADAEICATVRQYDAAARATEVEVCQVPGDRWQRLCGCATPTPPAGWTALLALFALRRRR